MVWLQRVVVLLLLFCHWDLLPRESPSGLRKALSAEAARWRRVARVIMKVALTAKLGSEQSQGIVRCPQNLAFCSG